MPQQTHLQRPCFCERAFTDAQVSEIEAMASRFAPAPPILIAEDRTRRDSIRSGAVANIPRNESTEAVYATLLDVADVLNESHFGFDLTGIAEGLQVAIYGQGDYFGWHVDASPQVPAVRKLTLTLQLSDPSEYEGGDFEIAWTDEPLRGPRGRGTVIALPSNLPHRVTTVTKGQRRALVCFLTGPQLR